jgi:hypothetical protein
VDNFIFSPPAHCYCRIACVSSPPPFRLAFYLVCVSRIQAEQYGKSRGIMMCICMLVVAIFVLTGILVLKWM